MELNRAAEGSYLRGLIGSARQALQVPAVRRSRVTVTALRQWGGGGVCGAGVFWAFSCGRSDSPQEYCDPVPEIKALGAWLQSASIGFNHFLSGSA